MLKNNHDVPIRTSDVEIKTTVMRKGCQYPKIQDFNDVPRKRESSAARRAATHSLRQRHRIPANNHQPVPLQPR